MMKKWFLSCASLILLYSSVHAQEYEYATSQLQKAAQKLNISGMLSEKSLTDTLFIKEQRIIVRKDQQGRIEHIGIPLFNAYIRNIQPSPIHDYLEFAALDKKFHVSENTLQLNKLVFSKGNWEKLYQLGDSCACTINNLGDKTYVVQWMKNNQVVLEISFPVDYELLANSNRREMETKFIKDLKVYKGSDNNAQQDVDTTQLKRHAIQGVYVKEGHNYIINAITSNTYYTISHKEAKLVYDNNHIAESMSNLLIAPAALPQAPITLSFTLSTYREESMSIDYGQLYNFCIASGCEPYFGYEGITDGMASGTLIMHNKQSGYNHIFYIQCPAKEIGNKEPHLKGTGYIYIPSSNIKNLLASPSKGRSKSYKYIAQ